MKKEQLIRVLQEMQKDGNLDCTEYQGDSFDNLLERATDKPKSRGMRILDRFRRQTEKRTTYGIWVKCENCLDMLRIQIPLGVSRKQFFKKKQECPHCKFSSSYTLA